MRLHKNLPNPFSNRTMIPFELSRDCHIRLSLHTADGEEIALIADEHRTQGEHVITFDADGIPSGSYFYRLTVDGVSRARTLEIVHRATA